MSELGRLYALGWGQPDLLPSVLQTEPWLQNELRLLFSRSGWTIDDVVSSRRIAAIVRSVWLATAKVRRERERQEREAYEQWLGKNLGPLDGPYFRHPEAIRLAIAALTGRRLPV